MNQTDMRTFAEEKYGNMEDWAMHALMETIQFSLIGVSHMATGKTRGIDFTLTMEGKRNLQNKLAIDILKMQDQVAKGEIKSNDPKFINKYQLLNEVTKQLDVSSNRQRFLNKNILAADTQNLFERYNRDYKRQTKSDKPAFDFKIQKSGKTEIIMRGSNPPLIKVNVNKMTPGTVPHEVFHAMMKQLFKNDVGLSKTLANNIRATLNKADLAIWSKKCKRWFKGCY